MDSAAPAAGLWDPARKYVFGFVHHGLYPLGAGYLPLLPAFRRLVPVRPVTLTASVCVTVPLLRDIVLWLGVRIVSRRTFEHTLRERRAVLVCPGGQAEMCLTNRLHRHKEFTVYSRHKGEWPCLAWGSVCACTVCGVGVGRALAATRRSHPPARLCLPAPPPRPRGAGFVRMALKQGAALVPVLALGEADSLRNLLEWPSMQRWCTKRLGFPIPFLIAGRWLLPLPAPTGLKFVVGEPIVAPPLAAEGEPSEAEVDALHARYYAALRALWARHAPSFPGYEGVSLVVV